MLRNRNNDKIHDTKSFIPRIIENNGHKFIAKLEFY